LNCDKKNGFFALDDGVQVHYIFKSKLFYLSLVKPFHLALTVRKLFSILFALLLLLNVMGYYGVFLGLQYKNDKEMLQKFDAEDYSDSELITITIPITIPYAIDSKDFARVDGKFEHKGEFYRLVKQKLSQDTLFVVCVKDHENKRIDDAMTSFVKTFTDKPVDNNQSNAKIVITFIKDYIPQGFTVQPVSVGWETDVVKESSCRVLKSSFIASIIHPPERA
jgi:hypothetical protein